MSAQVAVAFLLFALSMSLTPGPGNLTLLGILIRYGISATLPFVVGTSIGVVAIFTGASVGLVNVLAHYPGLFAALRLIGAGYLLCLAWDIANFCIEDSQVSERLPSYWAGASVQVLNPKAWIAAVTAITQFIDVSGNYMA